MLTDKYQFIANVLKGQKYVLSVIDGEDTFTLIGDELTAQERIWIADCVKKAVDATNERAQDS